MKKITVMVLLIAFFLLSLTACGHGNGDTTAPTVKATAQHMSEAELTAKLQQIRSDWTRQQVFSLLGEPDRYGVSSIVAEGFYTVNATTEAAVEFWKDGIKIRYRNTEDGSYSAYLPLQ